MATPQKRRPYAIIRDDSSFVIYELTKDDYETLSNSLVSEYKFCKISIGTFKLTDIQAVVEQKPEPKAKEKPLETGTPDLDVTAIAWLNEQKRIQEEFDNAYSDVEGGRFS